MKTGTRGFTLVELMVCVAVLGVVLGIAVPSFRQFIHGQQMVGTTNTLHAALLLARSESIKRRLPVLVDNGDGDWTSGWRIYADLNGNGVFDQGEPLVAEQAGLAQGVKVSGNTPVRRYVRYTPTGQTKLVGGAFQAGTISICHASGEQPVRRLVISATGRPRMARDEPGSCAG